jgi:CBS domain-containing protein
MKTDLFTVNSDEIIDLVACVMDWQSIRHVPVEDHEHRLVGLVTHRALLRLLAEGISVSGDKDTTEIPVRDVMVSDLETVSPDTSLLKAIEIIRESEVSCLPVTEDDDRLVGLLTERDFVDIAEDLLEQRLEDED